MQNTRKILVVVLDGLGDRAVESLGGKTPLGASNHPNLDWFAERGVTGIMDTISPGVRPGSDTSHLALLGYDPYETYTGRGPFEAAGIGILGKKGDVAFRCNFATVDEDMKVVDRRAGRIKAPDTQQLASTLDGMCVEGVEVTVREATEHRAVLLLSGDGLSPQVTDVDPHEMGMVRRCVPLSPEAELTARVVNEVVRRSFGMLNEHEVNRRRREEGSPVANIILPRGAGSFPDIEPFEERYNLRASCIAGVSLIKGICRICGIEVVEKPGFTGGLDTDMELKARTALELLERRDLVLMNVKAADIASHDGDAALKVKVIERLDEMVGILREELSDEVVTFTADHCTPIEVMDHSGDPVPIMIHSEGTISDNVVRYCEHQVQHGGLGRIRGKDLLPILIDKANRSGKFGA